MRIRWKADRLELSDFLVSIAGQEAVKGAASIPLTPANPNGILPFDQPTVSLDDMRDAIGVGLRHQLPIGPVRIDYGYNPSPKAGRRPVRCT